MHHSPTDPSPHQTWYDKTPHINRIFTFRQLGAVPVYAPKKKLEHPAHAAHYMYPASLTHIVIYNLRRHSYHAIHAEEFQSYHTSSDPTYTTTTAFTTRAQHHQSIPTTTQLDTPPLTNTAQAEKYSDALHWRKAHNDEVWNLHRPNRIKWLPPNFKVYPERIMLLITLYRYKC